MGKFQQYYKPTGKFDLEGLLVVPLLLLPMWVYSFIYAGLLHWNPIKFLNIIVFGIYLLGLNLIMMLAVNFSNNRSRGLAGAIALLLGVITIYCSWANYLAITFDEAPISLLRPDIFWTDFTRLFDEGAYTIFGILNKGIFGTMLWLLEAGGILFLTYHLARGTAEGDVFCETCTRWVQRIAPLYLFAYPHREELLTRFRNQDLSLLDEATDATADDSDVYSLDAASCNTCDDTHYMTLKQVRKDKEEVDESLVENLKITRDTFLAFFRRSGHWIPYIESGKYSFTVWLSIPLLTLAFLLGAIIYQGLATLIQNYVATLLLFAAYLFSVYFLTRVAIRLFATRNSVIGGFIGTVMGGLTVLITHGALLWASMERFEIYFFHPDLLWVFLEGYAEVYDAPGITWLWIIIESILVFLAPIIGASTVANSEVFCERCKEWSVERDRLLDFTHPDPDEALTRFCKQDASFLKDAAPVQLEIGYNEYFRISGTYCNSCQDFFTLSLSHVKHTESEKRGSVSTSTMIENMLAAKTFWETIHGAKLEPAKQETETETG